VAVIVRGMFTGYLDDICILRSFSYFRKKIGISRDKVGSINLKRIPLELESHALLPNPRG
jgi:hypothetical protein